MLECGSIWHYGNGERRSRQKGFNLLTGPYTFKPPLRISHTDHQGLKIYILSLSNVEQFHQRTVNGHDVTVGALLGRAYEVRGGEKKSLFVHLPSPFQSPTLCRTKVSV